MCHPVCVVTARFCWSESSHVNEWVWLRSSETITIKIGRSGLARGLQFANPTPDKVPELICGQSPETNSHKIQAVFEVFSNTY